MDLGQNLVTVSGSFEQVLATYLDDPMTGSAGCRIATIAAHVQYAIELKEFFDAEDSVSQIANSLPYPQAAQAGDSFGNYELLRELGRGGMGVVYLARDKRLDREVALKVIGSQGLRTPNEIWRFQNEVDAISQLSHPSLVPIFDYGEHRGQFYFTMKHIDGQSLAVWTATHIAMMQTATNKSIHERKVANIVRDIARAIHHAHQRGILHRDLKPTNILLERDGHPVVVDFGLAKQMQEDLAMTQTGALVGTPAYMAPELLLHSEFGASRKSKANPMTTAVDVYGLGSILYFLLTGRAPFEGQNLFELLSQVREQEARSLCTSNPLVDRGLDAICAKCLEKTPSDRYESAEALASDLECWLEGRPLVARPLPLREKVIRWCYRHKVLVGLLMLVSASILFGIGALTIGLQVATEARDSAIKQRQEALKNLRVVIQEINDLENRRPDLDEMRLDLLTRIQDQLRPMLNDNVHGSLADETSFWLEVDAGDVQENRRHFEAARAHFERAMHIAMRIPTDPKGNQRRIYSFAISHMGDLESTRANFRQAITHFEECLRVREYIAANYPSTQANADLALAKIKLAASMLSLQMGIGGEELTRDALRHAREAIVIFQTLVLSEPNNVWHARFRSVAREVIADALSRLKNWQAGMEECRLGLEELENAAERMPEYRLILEWHSCFLVDLLSVHCWWCGQFDRGEQAGLRTLQIRKRIVEFNPQAVQMHYLQSRSWDRIGQNQQGAGKFCDAVRSLQEAVCIAEELRNQGPDPSTVLREEIYCLEHLVFAAIAHKEFDSLTIESMNKLLVHLNANRGERDMPAPQASQILDLLVDKFQLLILQGSRDEASQVLSEARRFAEATPSLREEALHVSYLAEQSKLLDISGEPATQFLESRISHGMMLRLQSHFASIHDAEGMARVSERLALSANTCITKLCAARGMAKARGFDPTGVGIRYQPQFEKMLEDLRSYGDVADPWIKELKGE